MVFYQRLFRNMSNIYDKDIKIVKIVDSFNLLHVTGLFLQPHKTEKNRDFLMFSEDTGKGQ